MDYWKMMKVLMHDDLGVAQGQTWVNDPNMLSDPDVRGAINSRRIESLKKMVGRSYHQPGKKHPGKNGACSGIIIFRCSSRKWTMHNFYIVIIIFFAQMQWAILKPW